MTRNSTFRAGSNGWSLTSILRDVGTSWRLLRDPAVPFLLKLVLPVLALVYWLSPLDLMPGLPFDDIAVLLVAARLFVSLAGSMGGQTFQGTDAGRGSRRPEDDGDVIDTTWRVIDE